MIQALIIISAITTLTIFCAVVAGKRADERIVIAPNEPETRRNTNRTSESEPKQAHCHTFVEGKPVTPGIRKA